MAFATAKMNNDFICLDTHSGYRSTKLDPKGVQHLMAHSVSDADLGKLLLDTLSKSRFVLAEPREGVWIHPEATFDPDLYDREISSANYNKWVNNLIEIYSYKNKAELFKNMKNCSIDFTSDRLRISPSRHEKLDAWSGDGLTDADNVIIPADSSPAEIGAALRLAFSRCIG